MRKRDMFVRWILDSWQLQNYAEKECVLLYFCNAGGSMAGFFFFCRVSCPATRWCWIQVHPGPGADLDLKAGPSLTRSLTCCLGMGACAQRRVHRSTSYRLGCCRRELGNCSGGIKSVSIVEECRPGYRYAAAAAGGRAVHEEWIYASAFRIPNYASN